jgi:AraC family transcriptional regulator
MKIQKAGQFYGITNHDLVMNGLILTDTEYTLPDVDWHYHEHPYFTLILQGNLIEGNKKGVYYCSPGDLLLHHWQEPHYNKKPKGFSRGFHIEIEANWLKQYSLPDNLLEGSLQLKDPRLKIMMYEIYREMKRNTAESCAAIDSKLIQLLTSAVNGTQILVAARPVWVKRIEAVLQDYEESHCLSLSQLAHEAGVHPVHLSRTFTTYFGTSLGNYLRILKIQRALSQLTDTDIDLNRIAFNCGFADQSHFTRHFKSIFGSTPFAYRKLFK